MAIQFWTNNPIILFNKKYIFELWPTTDMCYEQKLNAISRLIILLSILGYILTLSKKIIFRIKSKFASQFLTMKFPN